MDREILKVMISHYGEQRQIVKCCEELAELSKELNKWLGFSLEGAFVNNPELKQRTVTQISSEMADVYVTLEQMKMIFNNAPVVEMIAEQKIARQKARMEG